MKSLKNKIFAGALALATLGVFGEKNLIAQSVDSLEIDTLGFGKIYQKIVARGFYNKELVAYFGCSDYEENHYTSRIVNWGSIEDEKFKIDYNNGLINYHLYFSNPYQEIAEFKNLTTEQISQDKKFAERTKKIINACESEEKLREMVKEIAKERIGKVPQIKQK